MGGRRNQEMTIEERAEALARKDFNKLNIPETVKKRSLRKRRQGKTLVFEAGERGILVRYFIRCRGKHISMKRIVTHFHDEEFDNSSKSS